MSDNMSDKLEKPAFDESQIINPHDLDFVKSITDVAQQEVVACSIISHRRPDKLAVGDPLPPLELPRLDSPETQPMVNLASVTERPLVLFFGSYT